MDVARCSATFLDLLRGGEVSQGSIAVSLGQEEGGGDARNGRLVSQFILGSEFPPGN